MREGKIGLEDLDQADPLTTFNETVSEDEPQRLYERLRELADENGELRQTVSELKQKLRTKNELDALIRPYASKAFWFMCSYSLGVAAMLACHGSAIISYELPDSVLEFLVGSTAVTVIGLVGMVLTGIFVGARK